MTWQICGRAGSEEGKQLSVHHIDYDKKNNTLNNLIPLCMRCHSMTNTNHVYWEVYFKERKEWSEQNENKANVLTLS